MPWEVIIPAVAQIGSALINRSGSKSSGMTKQDFGKSIPAPIPIAQSEMPQFNTNLGAPANVWNGNKMEMPGLANVHGLPSLPMIALRS